jgi:hypothetical protein
MHRKFVTTLLIIHLLLIMLVVSYNSRFDLASKGMIVVGILALYLSLLIIYLRRKVLYPVVLIGIVLYFLLNITVFSFYVLRSYSSLTAKEMWLFSFVFLPGIYSSLAYLIYLIRDRKKREIAA